MSASSVQRSQHTHEIGNTSNNLVRLTAGIDDAQALEKPAVPEDRRAAALKLRCASHQANAHVSCEAEEGVIEIDSTERHR